MQHLAEMTSTSTQHISAESSDDDEWYARMEAACREPHNDFHCDDSSDTVPRANKLGAVTDWADAVIEHAARATVVRAEDDAVWQVLKGYCLEKQDPQGSVTCRPPVTPVIPDAQQLAFHRYITSSLPRSTPMLACLDVVAGWQCALDDVVDPRVAIAVRSLSPESCGGRQELALEAVVFGLDTSSVVACLLASLGGPPASLTLLHVDPIHEDRLCEALRQWRGMESVGKQCRRLYVCELASCYSPIKAPRDRDVDTLEPSIERYMDAARTCQPTSVSATAWSRDPKAMEDLLRRCVLRAVVLHGEIVCLGAMDKWGQVLDLAVKAGFSGRGWETSVICSLITQHRSSSSHVWLAAREEPILHGFRAAGFRCTMVEGITHSFAHGSS